MEEIKIGSFLLAALFGLPGFLFIQILAKFCFSSSRSYGGRSLHILASLIFSTIVLFFFDSGYIHPHLATFFHFLQRIGFPFSAGYIDFLSKTPLSNALFDYIFLNDKPADLSHVVGTLVFVVTAFSVICAIILAGLINVMEWYSKADLATYVATGFHFLDFFGRRFVRLFDTRKRRAARIRQRLSVRPQRTAGVVRQPGGITRKNWYYSVPLKLLEAILALALILILISVGLVALSVVMLKSTIISI